MARDWTIRQPGEDPIDPPQSVQHEWTPCVWTLPHGQSCPFIATIWLDPTGNYEFNKQGQVTAVIRPGYCGWHYETLTMPRLGQSFDEFESWHAYKRRRYCTQFSHHDASYIWPVLQGTVRDTADRWVIQPCRQHDCWVWDTLENQKWASPWAPPPAYRSIHELARMLARKFTLSEPLP